MTNTPTDKQTASATPDKVRTADLKGHINYDDKLGCWCIGNTPIDPQLRTISAEKPTDRSTKAQWEALANESIADAGYWKAETRKAQAHAAQLAETLRGVIWKCDAHGSWKPTQAEREAMHAALAAYESEIRP